MSQHEMAIYCKSFRGDFSRLKILIDSMIALQIETPMLLSVPQKDERLLAKTIHLPANVTVVHDEAYLIRGRPFKHGWRQQQICKLSVYRTGYAKSYLMVDSDAYFIDDLRSLFQICKDRAIVAHPVFTKFLPMNDGLFDLIRNETGAGQPVFPAGDITQFDAHIPPILKNMESVWTGEPDGLINRLFGAPWLAYQPAQIFHASILSEFALFLAERRLDFYDCIKISPWEYTWYACFALARWPNQIPGYASPVLHFADEDNVALAKANGFTVDDFRKRFVAIQMATRHFDRVRY